MQTLTELRKPSSPYLLNHAEAFLEAAILLGHEFLTCGGPVTRLETALKEAGTQYGFEASITATPTSIMISCHDPVMKTTHTRNLRIDTFQVDLARLRFVDKLLRQLISREIHPWQVTYRIKRWMSLRQKRKWYSPYLCQVGIGAGAGLLTGFSFPLALMGGFVTLAIQFAQRKLSQYLHTQSIFGDFAVCLIAFVFSFITYNKIGVPAPALFIGTLVYVVPGLGMTTGISEIVDQNYLSGSIRLLKAFFTFMSMALAFFIAKDVVSLFNINISSSMLSISGENSVWIKFLGAALIVICSGIEFSAHRKSIPRILLCGMVGTTTYFAAVSLDFYILSSFLGAFAIGITSFWIGQKYKHPSQIYSVPSILILVPGMLAFSSIRGLTEVNGMAQFGATTIMQALLVSFAIVFGLAAGRIPAPYFVLARRRTLTQFKLNKLFFR